MKNQLFSAAWEFAAGLEVEMSKFTTPYSLAWDKFKLSDDFEDAVDVSTLGTTPEYQRYLENRLRVAFDAGWNSKTSHILDALMETLKKK